MRTVKRILVAGIGNIFKADDGFGVEVVKRLASKMPYKEVDVVDFGIRGLDLAYTLMDQKHDLVIFVDVVKRGGAPGTIYRINPDLEGTEDFVVANGHDMHPAQVLNWLRAMGGEFPSIRLIGCEPDRMCTEEDLEMGLSDPVRSSINHAIESIHELIEEAQCMN